MRRCRRLPLPRRPARDVPKRVSDPALFTASAAETGAHEEEGQVEVCQRRPREDELDGVVDELDLNQTASDGCTGQRRKNKATDLQDDLPEEVLPRRPDTEPEHGGMDGCEQRAVEPATTLGDEFRDRGRDIRRGLRALDVLQARGTVSIT